MDDVIDLCQDDERMVDVKDEVVELDQDDDDVEIVSGSSGEDTLEAMDMDTADTPGSESFRPAKKAKTAGDDVEVLGSAGSLAGLPHLRCNCPDNPFSGNLDLEDRQQHCDKCFCYVCDKLVEECSKWHEHCNATDTGPTAYIWKKEREKAKLGVAAPPPPPSSFTGTAQRTPLGSLGNQPASTTDTKQAAQTVTYLGLSAPYGMTQEEFEDWYQQHMYSMPTHYQFTRYSALLPAAPPPELCPCTNCKLVKELVIHTAYPLVRLLDLTQEERMHVIDVSIVKATKYAFWWYRNGTNYGRAQHKEEDLRPHIRELTHSNGKYEVLIAPRITPASEKAPAPWEVTPDPQGPHVPPPVLLGSLSAGFWIRLSTDHGHNLVKTASQAHKDHFKRYLGKDPYPQSLLNRVHDAKDHMGTGNEGYYVKNHLDATILQQLLKAQKLGEVRLACRAKYHPTKNYVVLQVKVTLTHKLLWKDKTSMTQYGSGVFSRRISPVPEETDYSQLVERLIWGRAGVLPPEPPKVAAGSAGASAGGSAGESDASGLAATSGAGSVGKTAPPRTSAAEVAATTSATSSSTNPSTSSATGSGAGGARGGAATDGPNDGADSASEAGEGENSDTEEDAQPGPPSGKPSDNWEYFTPSKANWGGYSSVDVSLKGLLTSLRQEQKRVSYYLDIPHMLLALENLGHPALPEDPPGLTVSLYPHQKQNVQWMLDQERLPGGLFSHIWAEVPRKEGQAPLWFSPMLNRFSHMKPFEASPMGGFLCDEMGLGKTLSTLALHMLNPAPAIIRGVDCGGQGRVDCKTTLVICHVSLVGQWVEEVRRLTKNLDPPLTIYPYHGGSRTKNIKKLAKYDLLVTTYGVVQADHSRNHKEGGAPLESMHFWRIVLDESHTIRHNTHSVRAIELLSSRRRWCVTGTPFNTKISDIANQLEFLGVKHISNNNLGDRALNTAYKNQIMAFLRRIVMRHTQKQNTKADKKNILGLPQIHREVVPVNFTSAELTAYKKFEKEMQDQYKDVRHLLTNAKGSHTMKVLTLLARFRQVCSGGQLIFATSAAAEGTEGEDGENVVGAADAHCLMCGDLMEEPTKTPCGHVFCHDCITGHLAAGGDEDEAQSGPCPKCKKNVALDRLQVVGSVGPSSAPSADDDAGADADGAATGADAGAAEGAGGSTPTAAPQADPGLVVMESKLTVLVAKLEEIRTKDPTAKSLVFSQFNTTLTWLKNKLPARGFQFRTLTGDMSRQARTKALQDFQNDPPTTIFLLSVRSGGFGINLTQADHVFMMEPCLNTALEQQAVGRVHRLGQTREVHVTKLVMKDSLEERILQTQKDTDIANAAGGGSVAGHMKSDKMLLRIEEYNKLFGVSDDVWTTFNAPRYKKSQPKPRKAVHRSWPTFNILCSGIGSSHDYGDDYGDDSDGAGDY